MTNACFTDPERPMPFKWIVNQYTSILLCVEFIEHVSKRLSIDQVTAQALGKLLLIHRPQHYCTSIYSIRSKSDEENDRGLLCISPTAYYVNVPYLVFLC